MLKKEKSRVPKTHRHTYTYTEREGVREIKVRLAKRQSQGILQISRGPLTEGGNPRGPSTPGVTQIKS